MLYLIGIGLKPEHITLEALNIIKNCNNVYLEAYTSKYSQGTVKDLEQLIGRSILPLNREHVEQRSQDILNIAKNNDVCLLVYGNPLTATTHCQIILDAKRMWIKTKVIPCVSVTNCIGETGLTGYRFGQHVTITFWQENFKPDSFYTKILENKKFKLHTLCLLDLNAERGEFMSINKALETLLAIEKKKRKRIIQKSTLVGLIALGNDKQRIIKGTFKELAAMNFNDLPRPQSLIVCGDLNEKEREFFDAFNEPK